MTFVLILFSIIVIEFFLLIIQISQVLKHDRIISKQSRSRRSLYVVPSHGGFYRRALFNLKRMFTRIRKSMNVIDISSIL